MGSSCSSTVHRSFESDINDEQKWVMRRKTPKSKELRLIVSPWKQPYEIPYTAYSEEEEPFRVSKLRLSWGTEALDREDEEEGSKIDGLCGSDLVAFYGLRRKDILNFLERSLSEKEKTCTRGIRRIERRPSKFAWLVGPDNMCMHIVTWNMNGKVHKSIYAL